MKFVLLIGVILLTMAIGVSSGATRAECLQRCSYALGADDTVSASIYDNCMNSCLGGASQPAPLPDVWAAIAVSPSTLLEGHSWNFKSEPEASQRALKECQGVAKGGDCKVVVTVADVCVALVISKPEKVWAVGGPIGAVNYAENNGMLKCQRAGGKSCSIATSLCADGIRHVVKPPGSTPPPAGRRQ